MTNAVYAHMPISMRQDAARRTDEFRHGIKARHDKEKEAEQKGSAQLSLPALNVVTSVATPEGGKAK